MVGEKKGKSQQKDEFKYTKSNNWLSFPSFTRPHQLFCLNVVTKKIEFSFIETSNQNDSMDVTRAKDNKKMKGVLSLCEKKDYLIAKKAFEEKANALVKQIPLADSAYIVSDYESLRSIKFFKYISGFKNVDFLIFVPNDVQLRKSKKKTLGKNIKEFLKNQSQEMEKKRSLQLQSVADIEPYNEKIDRLLSICLLIIQQGGPVTLATLNMELAIKGLTKGLCNFSVINCHALSSLRGNDF